jgi:hypothetical protein
MYLSSRSSTHVGKNRAHHATLRYAAIGGIELPFLQVAGSEKSAHEADEAMIMEALAQDIEQNRVSILSKQALMSPSMNHFVPRPFA